MMLDVSFFLLGLNVNSLVSSPSGLPAGAIAYADFKAGTYYYGGNALSDFLVEDTDWGAFNPTAVVAGTGIYSTNPTNPVLGSTLATSLLASGFSATFTYSVTDLSTAEGFGLLIAVLDLPNYDHEWDFDFCARGVTGQPGKSNFYDGTVNQDILSNQDVGRHKAGVTVHPDTGAIAICIDGGTGSDRFFQATAVAATPNSIAITCQGALAWENVVFYPAKTNAELQALTA